MFFDTHAHYDDERFAPDRDALLASLPDSGVGCVVNCGSDTATSLVSLSLARRFPHVYAAAGIHPESAGEYTADDLAAVEAMLGEEKVVPGRPSWSCCASSCAWPWRRTCRW